MLLRVQASGLPKLEAEIIKVGGSAASTCTGGVRHIVVVVRCAGLCHACAAPYQAAAASGPGTCRLWRRGAAQLGSGASTSLMEAVVARAESSSTVVRDLARSGGRNDGQHAGRNAPLDALANG